MLETPEWCQAEDAKRVHDLRALDQDEWTHLYRDGPLYLAEWLEDGVTCSGYEPNRASEVSMRELRLRFRGSALDFIMQHRAGSPKWITARHPAWHFGFDDYYRWKDIAVSVPRQFRAMLRIAGVMDLPGFLISYMHTQFDQRTSECCLQFRGIAGGEKLTQFRQLSRTLADQAKEPLIRDYVGAIRMG